VQEIVDVLGDLTVDDPYRWLEDGTSREVRQWASAQDAAARALLRSYPGRDRLAQRFRELYYVDSVSPPRKRAGRFFYLRTHSDREKAVLYWRASEREPEQVLLDPNRWSTDGTISLGAWVPSWDGRRVVYARRANGADEAVLHVVDVDSGGNLPDVIEGGKYASPSWTPDGAGFFYEYLPADPSIPVADRPGRTELRFHRLGTDPRRDPVVHPCTWNPSTFLAGQLSRDGRWLFVHIYRGWNESDLWMRDLGARRDPLAPGEWRRIVEGNGAIYSVDVWQDQLFILTDEGAPRRRVFKASVVAPDRANWHEIVPEDPGATLEDMSVLGGRLALVYLRRAAGEIRLAELDGRPARPIPLPGIGSVAGVSGNPDEDDAYFAYSSFTTPQQVYRTSIARNGLALWAKVVLPVDASQMQVEQVQYPSKDGTAVSMFLVHRRGMAKDGSHPVLLNGYGGFNVSLTPSFRAGIYPWLEAGGVYAVPNLRGGGEYGRAWHEAGRGPNKQNVFDDFAAAAEWLVREKWTVPARLGITGGSNGGLLVGVAMTQRPELFGAVVCSVPLLDMVRYTLYGSGKTWIPEYGDPRIPADLGVLFAYSPYHHVRPGTKYPPLLLMSSDDDDRVDPMHARKFAARVLGAGGSATVLLRIERNAGHGGADQVRRAIESSADQYAFLFEMLHVQAPGEADAAAK